MRKVLLLTVTILTIFFGCSSEDSGSNNNTPPSELFGEWNINQVKRYDLEGNFEHRNNYGEGSYIVTIDSETIGYAVSWGNGTGLGSGSKYTYNNGVIECDFYGNKEVVSVTATELHLRDIPEEGDETYSETFATKIEE